MLTFDQLLESFEKSAFNRAVAIIEAFKPIDDTFRGDFSDQVYIPELEINVWVEATFDYGVESTGHDPRLGKDYYSRIPIAVSQMKVYEVDEGENDVEITYKPVLDIVEKVVLKQARESEEYNTPL